MRRRRVSPERGISADTLMDVIAGGAWYAVCVRHVTNTDRAAKELTELVLNGVLRAHCSRTRGAPNAQRHS